MAQILDDFSKRVETQALGVHAAAVSWRGKKLGEYRVVADEPHILHSLSKSFTSTAVGMAVEEGRVALTDRVVDLLREESPAEPSAKLQKLTVRDLLIMAPGRKDPVMMMHQRAAIQGSWIRHYLAQPLDEEPGHTFYYDTGCTYTLAAILQKLTGETLLEYLMPRLFAPLGIERPFWEESPEGINIGGAGLFLRTSELLPFGELYLNQGEYRGKRLLGAEWIREATRKQIDTPQRGGTDSRLGYGYQFWMCQHAAYRADGAYAQFCIICPEQDAVIAVNADSNYGQEILDAVWEEILPKLG
jgi:CubicO group peptidase (beta-lactamase class C family)